MSQPIISAQGCLCFHPEKTRSKNDICQNIILAFYEVSQKMKKFTLNLEDSKFHAIYKFNVKKTIEKKVNILLYFDNGSIWNSKWLSGIGRLNPPNSELHVLIVHNNFLRIWKLNNDFLNSFKKSPQKFQSGPHDKNGEMYSGYALPFDLSEAYLSWCNDSFKRSLSHKFVERALGMITKDPTNQSGVAELNTIEFNVYDEEEDVYSGRYWQKSSSIPVHGILLDSKKNEKLYEFIKKSELDRDCQSNIKILDEKVDHELIKGLTHDHYVKVQKTDKGRKYKEYYSIVSHLTKLQNSICEKAKETMKSHTKQNLGMLLSLDTGMGKTRTGINVYYNIRQSVQTYDNHPLLIIVAPSRTFDNFKQHFPTDKIVRCTEIQHDDYSCFNNLDAIFVSNSDILSIKRKGDARLLRNSNEHFPKSFITSILQGLDEKILQNDSDNNPREFVLLVDEIHNAMNSKTDLHRFVNAFSNHTHCKYRIFMTATPIVKENDGRSLLRLMHRSLTCELQCISKQTFTDDGTNYNVYVCNGYSMSIYLGMTRFETYATEKHRRYTINMEEENFNIVKNIQDKESKNYLRNIFLYLKEVTQMTPKTRGIDFQHVDEIDDEKKQSWLRCSHDPKSDKYRNKFNASKNKDVVRRIQNFYNLLYSAFKDMKHDYINEFEKKENEELLESDIDFSKTISQLRVLSKFSDHKNWLNIPREGLWKHRKFNMNVFDQESKSIALHDENLWGQVLKIVEKCKKDMEFPIVIYEHRVELGVKKIFDKLIEMYPEQKGSIALVTGKECKLGDLRNKSILKHERELKGIIGKSKDHGRDAYVRFLLEHFDNGKIDIFIFSGVISEGLNIKATQPLPQKLIYKTVDENTMKYSISKNENDFWKKKTMFVKKKDDKYMKHKRKVGSEKYISTYVNPVQHFINISGSWDWKTAKQAIGRVLRNDSHCLNFNKKGNIDVYEPRGTVTVHNLILSNPVKDGEYGFINTYDEHTEDVMMKKLKSTEQLTLALSSFCVNCRQETCLNKTDTGSFHTELKEVPFTLSKFQDLKKRCPVVSHYDKLGISSLKHVDDSIYDLF